jgi:hypothetical protein
MNFDDTEKIHPSVTSVLLRASSLPVFTPFIQNTERNERVLLLSKIILPDL